MGFKLAGGEAERIRRICGKGDEKKEGMEVRLRV